MATEWCFFGREWFSVYAYIGRQENLRIFHFDVDFYVTLGQVSHYNLT